MTDDSENLDEYVDDLYDKYLSAKNSRETLKSEVKILLALIENDMTGVEFMRSVERLKEMVK